jgi:hypothetical protein
MFLLRFGLLESLDMSSALGQFREIVGYHPGIANNTTKHSNKTRIWSMGKNILINRWIGLDLDGELRRELLKGNARTREEFRTM